MPQVARSFVRTLTAVAVAFTATACGELAHEPTLTPTAPLALALAWPGDEAANSVFGADIDAVRVYIARYSEETVVDTVIPWATNDQGFRLAFDVVLRQRVESLYVYVDLMVGQATHFYSSSQVILQAEVVPSIPPLVLSYIGPGYDAVFLTVTPRGTFVQPTGTAQFTAQAQNGSQAVVTPPIAWSVSDTRLGTISASGLFTAKSALGEVWVKATTPTGLADSVAVQVSVQTP